MKNNPRITKKERGLLKGAIRRVFHRSELRLQAVKQSMVTHSDPSRPRVKKWSKCFECHELIPTYLMEIDHEHPIVPVDMATEDMSLDDIVDNCWCPIEYLHALCEKCHREKTSVERKLRVLFRSTKKGNKV